MRDEAERRVKKEKLFQFYRDSNITGQTTPSEHVIKTLPKDDDLLNIDGSSFNARAYLEKHLKEKDLSDLMLEEKVLTEQIRSLDSEMQTLMYDNYSKFISATDTIRLMKSDFKYVEEEMDCLLKNMSSIRSLSDGIKDGLVGERVRVKNLINTQQTLNKFKHLVDLPAQLRQQLVHSQWTEAINDLNKAKFVLRSYSSTPSFKSIRDDCSQLVRDIQKKVWDQFNRAVKPNEFLASLKVLRQLGVHTSKLSESFISLARIRLNSAAASLQKNTSSCSQSATPSDGSVQPSSKPEMNSAISDCIRPDILHFTNLITGQILDELSSFASVYANLFSADRSFDEDDETEHTVIDVLDNRMEADSSDLPLVELESRLLVLVKELMETFFKITEERFSEEQYSCPDTALLVRALNRMHGRVQIFTRSLSDAVNALGSLNPTSSIAEWDTDPIGPSALPAIIDGMGSSSSTSDQPSFGDQTVAVCQHCLTTALQLANRVSEARTQWYLDGLCLSAVDSITDLRQKLVSINATTRASDESNNQLSVLSENLNNSLSSQLRGRIQALEVFLSPENTFVSRSGFREQFSLVQLREKLVVGYLKFLLAFFDDLTKTAAGRVPGPILLLLAKLCLTWTNTGTIGQLLAICEELLSSGSKPWSLGSTGHSPRPSTHTGLTVTLAQMATFNCFITPTTPKELTEKFREVSGRLLISFARLEGTNVAQLLRKSVEARDWLKSLEPRSVRSVIKRVIEDLNVLDQQISQLLPLNARNKDRGSESRSTRSGFSSLRPSGSTHFLESQTRANSSGTSTAELDPALATQLRRLFTQRVDIFSAVEANCESLLLGIIKIGLKTLVECVRLQTFGKFGLQQTQVDCRYLQIHLWHFVNDEKLIGMLLDDVVYSVVQRCVEPQLMEDSIVDSICDRA
ncbi:VPS51 [Fasciola hepatica]|uniref:Vacuolar protein sorting-associated protein 51 homolog n=1 Tax=Fasciola hepatica TaxID=6192 RepID=A0A4E0S3B5_FASHE|nr:VPS51 [Fasciola hepatica]